MRFCISGENFTTTPLELLLTLDALPTGRSPSVSPATSVRCARYDQTSNPATATSAAAGKTILRALLTAFFQGSAWAVPVPAAAGPRLPARQMHSVRGASHPDAHARKQLPPDALRSA